MSAARHDYRYQRGRTPICERCGCRRRSVGTLRKWQYSVDGKTWMAERPPCKGAVARKPAEAPDLDRAARRLVTIFHLYSGHTVDSRGPAGCIMDALDEIAPEVAAEIREGAEASEICQRRWPEP
jgi:hypothetical protein